MIAMTSYAFASIVTMLSLLAVFVQCEEIRTCAALQGRCTPWRSCPETSKPIKPFLYPPDLQELITLVEACGSSFRSENALICCLSLGPEEPSTIPPLINVPLAKCDIRLPSECGRRPPGSKIMGGVEDSENVHTWAVFLEFTKPGFVAGRSVGTMITDRYVLTAAHYLVHLEIDDVTMYFGLFKRSELVSCLKDGNCQKKKAAQFVIHEEYQEVKRLNDVALVLSVDPVEMTDFISPICLPLSHTYDESAGNFVFSFGWGMTVNEKFSDTKRVVLLKVIPQDDCKNWLPFNSTVLSSTMCTIGSQSGHDVCHGDAGAPLLQLHQNLMYVVGVFSYGPTCGMSTNVPGKAMRVSHYLDWILDKISCAIA